MVKLLSYIEITYLNSLFKIKGNLLKLYLILHGCKVGRNLKCRRWPFFKGVLYKNISIGDNVDLGYHNTIELTKNCSLELSDNVLLGSNIYICCTSVIRIGKWSAVAENVSIRDTDHNFRKDEYYRKQPAKSKPIFIGKDAGIASGTVILKGSIIPDGTFIGAKCIVNNKDKLEDYSIYAGNPLRLIFKRL